MPVQIVKPKLQDVESIKQLLDHFAQQQAVLPRSILDICEKIQIFWIAKDKLRVIGCVAVQFYPDYFVEIQSLAVGDAYQNMGIGHMLVKRSIKDARILGAKRVFALTNIPEYFEQFGFAKIQKTGLPQKIWKESINFELRQNPCHSAIDLLIV